MISEGVLFDQITVQNAATELGLVFATHPEIVHTFTEMDRC